MCTLMTVSKDYFNTNRATVNARIRRDHVMNSDGVSLILVDRKHTILLSTAAMTLAPIISLLNTTRWDRMFLHQRMATGGAVNVGNCHGWATRNGGVVHVMHNGVLSSLDGGRFGVDSQAILYWLETRGWDALDAITEEDYANVFLILNGVGHTVIRSRVGGLMTDGCGNFSTNTIPDLVYTVPVGAFGTGAAALTWPMLIEENSLLDDEENSHVG